MSSPANGHDSDPESSSGVPPITLATAPFPTPDVLVDGSKSYLVVSWDLDSTGRRLLDEICQIGGFYHLGSTGSGDEKETGQGEFSQYVMPYKNPNPGARRSFGIKVVNIGRYRMLKDLETGKILKTKSEISALQEFISWLREAKTKSGKTGLILASHEPARKVLVPLILEALKKYNLFDDFSSVVDGFVNGVNVVRKFGEKDKITSYSLRSLCKTVLGDTNPKTASATDRSKVLVNILSRVTSPDSTDMTIDASKVATLAVTVTSERHDLEQLKQMLSTQTTLRPIFEPRLRQRRNIRGTAMALRRKVAESGVDYSTLSNLYNDNKVEESKLKESLSAKVTNLSSSDVEELIKLLNEHFEVSTTEKEQTKTSKKKVTEEETKKEPVQVEGSK